MGIPNQAERLAEIERLMSQVEVTPALRELFEKWWVRIRPDKVVCTRCVMLKKFLAGKEQE